MKQMRQSILLVAVVLAAVPWFWPWQAAACHGHFYVIGTGPAGPRTATLQALDTMKRMDIIVAPDEHVKLFAEYIGPNQSCLIHGKGSGTTKEKAIGN